MIFRCEISADILRFETSPHALSEFHFIPHLNNFFSRLINSIHHYLKTCFWSYDQNSPRHPIPLCIRQRPIRRFIERKYLRLHLHSVLSLIDPQSKRYIYIYIFWSWFLPSSTPLFYFPPPSRRKKRRRRVKKEGKAGRRGGGLRETEVGRRKERKVSLVKIRK